jgi:hypothetical protein
MSVGEASVRGIAIALAAVDVFIFLLALLKLAVRPNADEEVLVGWNGGVNDAAKGVTAAPLSRHASDILMDRSMSTPRRGGIFLASLVDDGSDRESADGGEGETRNRDLRGDESIVWARRQLAPRATHATVRRKELPRHAGQDFALFLRE